MSYLRKYQKRENPESAPPVEAVVFDGSSTGVVEILMWKRTGEYVRRDVRTKDAGVILSLDCQLGTEVVKYGDVLLKVPGWGFNVMSWKEFERYYEEVE